MQFLARFFGWLQRVLARDGPASPRDPRHALGRAGERAAEQFLRARGYRTVVRGFRTPVGELDLVVRAPDSIVIVEVKTRRDERFAAALDSVTPEKQARTARAARWFVHRRKLEHLGVRFDVITVVFEDGPAAPPRIEHFEDAFTPR